MIHLKLNKCIFNYRVVAILTNKNRVLLHTPDYFGHYAVPGGRCNELETSEDAIRRELKEELNINNAIVKMEWIVENFFKIEDKKYHEISFYFSVLLSSNSKLYNGKNVFGHEGKDKIEFIWFNIDKLSEIDLKPSFIKKEINNLGNGIKHIIFKDKDR